jgi:hypothetical protein
MPDSLDLPVLLRDRARVIVKSMGSLEYIDNQAKTIASQLAEREHLPSSFHTKIGNQLVECRVTRWTPKNSQRRNISKKDLKQRFPLAYAAAVTESEPANPYQLRFESVGRGASKEWAAIKAEGASMWETQLRAKYSASTWTPVDRLRVLKELRDMVKTGTAQLETRKEEFIDFVTANHLPLILLGESDGRAVLRESPMKTTVDYDILECDFPQAAALITRTRMIGSPRIVITQLAEEVEDDDAE